MENSQIKDSKKISRCEYKVIKINDLRNYEYLVIELSINKALQELLLKKLVCTIKPTKDLPNPIISYNYMDNEGKRYLIFGTIRQKLVSSYQLFSDLNLLNDGKINLKFSSLDHYRRFISDFEFNFKTILEMIRDLEHINITTFAEI